MPKATSGSRVRSVSARAFNAAIAAGQAFEQGRASSILRDQNTGIADQGLFVKNLSGGSLLAFSVVSVGDALVDFSFANGNLSRYRNACEGNAISLPVRVPAIIQQAAIENDIVQAIASGLTFARVDVTGSGMFVDVSSGSSQLVRVESGGIGRIVGNATAISLIMLGDAANSRLIHVKSPAGGIGARSGLNMGSASCLYYSCDAAGIKTLSATSITVYNDSSGAVGANKDCIAGMNADGLWVVIAEDC